MAKLTYEDKKEIVRLYDEEHLGCSSIAKKYNVTQSTVQKIVQKYHIHGEESLRKHKNKSYSPEFKMDVINRALNGEAKFSLAIEYNITETQINSWLKNYEELGYDGLVNKTRGRPPAMKKESKKPIDPNDKDAIIREKDARIEELEAEVAALKKLRALVLQRNTQQTKKKQ